MPRSNATCLATGLILLLFAAPADTDPMEDVSLAAASTAGAASIPGLQTRWREAVAIEQRMFDQPDRPPAELIDELTRAAELFALVADAEDERAEGYWRASRATWLSGELLPLDASAARVQRFEAGLDLADRGLARDPECAECMLWKFTAMGRLRTTQSVFEGVRQLKDMAELLDRGIELHPPYRDNELNSTLGNLHYASAVFYRLVPDWFWVRWVIGVKGDKERALRHSQQALALHPTRLDYKIELGTQLLCLGASKRKHRARLEEGRGVLGDAIDQIPGNEDERREIVFAKMLLEDPHKACGYSGDKVLDIDENAAKRAKDAA